MTSIGEFFSLLRRRSVLIFILLILTALGIWKFIFDQSADSANYLTATVERGEIHNLVTATGVLQPRDYVDVGAQVSGQLKKLNVVVGQEVKAGDLLAEIDATVYKAKVDGIRAQLLNQKAQLGDKEAQLLLAKIRLERQQNLFKDDATTKESLQTAEAGFQSSSSLLKALQAQIQQTESSLRAEEANLEYARIYAPMSGTVVSITSRQGQTLNANQQAPTIMRIADLSTMTVQTQVSEADIGKLRIGMPVYFTTLGGQDYRWYSKLNRVEPTPQVTNNVVLYNALFEVPNDTKTLMTSMSTQVFFIASEAKDTLIIPASAVNFKPRVPGDEKNKSWGDKKSDWQDRKKNAQADSTQVEKDKVERNDIKNDKASVNENSSASTEVDKKEFDKTQTTGAHREERRRNRERRGPPIATGEVKPQPAIVQVMDARGNLSERKIVTGISSRVQVQVLEGLQEGEKIVSGMRQLEKPNASTSGSPVGVPPGVSGGRPMR
ncbi:MAG: efflux RND transporter periplasmic adaptor subunit [Gammaproteobacteria bacterium]|nr:MAG: efflux RND transporter periplasmic adaptor subunit [Gammaproteobacteria bacterium]